MKTCHYRYAERDDFVYFLNDRVRASSEFIYDLWTVYMVHPNILLERSEKYVKGIKPGETIRFRVQITNWQPGEPLFVLNVGLEVFNETTLTELRILEEFLYEAPADLRLDEGTSTSIPYEEWLPKPIKKKK